MVMSKREFYENLLRQVARDFAQRLHVLQMSVGMDKEDVSFSIYVEDNKTYYTYLSEGAVIQVNPEG